MVNSLDTDAKAYGSGWGVTAKASFAMKTSSTVKKNEV